jgi:hypothetical protein
LRRAGANALHKGDTARSLMVRGSDEVPLRRSTGGDQTLELQAGDHGIQGSTYHTYKGEGRHANARHLQC